MNRYVIVFHGKGALTMRTLIGILQAALQIVTLAVGFTAAKANDALPETPELIGYVSDYARVISPAHERRLAEIGSELERKTGFVVRVVTLPSLGGSEIDRFATYLLDRWCDSATAASTILIVDAVAEKQMRVELGEGLSDVLTPKLREDVQRQLMFPLLSRGNRGEAYTLAVTELSVAIGMNRKVALYSVPGYLSLQPAAYPPFPANRKQLPELLLFVPLLMFMVGMARLEIKMARATPVFGALFRSKWQSRWSSFRRLLH